MLFRRLVGACVLCAAAVVQATTAYFPDYYTEPGIRQDKSYDSVADYEAIDPFGGTVKLHHVDLFLPGDGGADITIERSYMPREPRTAAANESWQLGRGWAMHMGRLWRNTGGLSVCDVTLGDSVDQVARLPVFESSDGVKRVLRYRDALNLQSPTFRSLDGWSGGCGTSTAYPQLHFILYSPDGVRYEMEAEGATTAFQGGDLLANVRRITYPSGNYVLINYEWDTRGFRIMKSVAGYNRLGADRRLVSFGYSYDLLGYPRLSSMTSAGKTWNYSSSTAGTDYFLDSVTYPNGQVWRYGYVKTLSSSNVPSSFNIQSVTNPYGGKVEYSYLANAPQFYPLLTSPHVPVIYQKKITAGGPLATWTYTFTPASARFSSNASDSGMDKTLVSGPNGTIEYYHFGYRSAAYDSVWAVGTLRKKRYLEVGGALKRTELYEYTKDASWAVGKNFLPHDWAINPSYDPTTYVAQLTKKTISTTSSDAAVTTYSSFFGPQLPQTVVETGPGNSRQTSITYAADIYTSFKYDWWLITPIYKTDVISDSKGLTGKNKAVIQTFYSTVGVGSFGQVKTRQEYGVESSFEYDSTGNLLKKTDPALFSSTYTGYKHGTYQAATLPETVQLKNIVDDFGRVVSMTDGENHTTGYGYTDYSNHLTSIDLPINNDVGVQWTWQYGATNGTKIVTRGNLEVVTTFDGFARPTLVDARDKATGKHIYVRTSYDGAGNKICETLPKSTAPTTCSKLNGTEFRYDVLGRLTGASYADGKTASTEYLDLARVRTTDARGKIRTSTFEYYGNPEERWLKSVSFTNLLPLADLSYTRNFRGQILTESQAGLKRIYTYDAKGFLQTEVNPELGQTITYTYFNDGKVKTRTLGTSPATSYEYDGLRRLKSVLFPDGKAYTFQWYKNSKPKLQEVRSGGVLGTVLSSRSFPLYDANDNLKREEVTVDGVTLVTSYNYTTNDALDNMVYPSGQTVAFGPDAFGRPLKVGGYASNADYYPGGQLKSLTWGNNTQANFLLSSRDWVSDIRLSRVGGGDILSWALSYDGNGNTTSLTDRMPGAQYGLSSLVYDEIDRLKNWTGIMTGGVTRSLGYDGLGNIQTYSGAVSKTLGYDAAKNRLTSMVEGTTQYSYAYDDWGNIKSNGRGQTYTFDHDHNLTCTNCGLASEMAYIYTPGNLLAQQSGKDGSKRRFFYSSSGQLLHERSSGAFARGIDYLYLGSRMVAQREYVFADAKPGNFTVTKISTDPADYRHRLSWTAPPDTTGITGYRIISDGVTTNLGTGTSVTTTLLPNTNHTATVQAVDAEGNLSLPASASYFYDDGNCSPAYGEAGSKSYIVNVNIGVNNFPSRTVTATASLAFPDATLPNNFIKSLTIIGGGTAGVGPAAYTCTSQSLTIPRDGGDHPTISSYWAVACDKYGNCAKSSTVNANP